MTLELEDLAEALARRPVREHAALPGRRNDLRAGVCVPLDRREGRTDVLLTLRPTRFRRHAGEVSFPGGRPEPGDATLQATALRELREELGVDRVRVLGRLASMPVYTSDFRLEPFVVALDAAQPLQPDPGEVARVLRLDLAELLAAPAVEGLPVEHEGRSWLLPLFRVEGLAVFGATALTLWELVGVVAELAGTALPPLEPSELTWAELVEHKAAAALGPARGRRA